MNKIIFVSIVFLYSCSSDPTLNNEIRYQFDLDQINIDIDRISNIKFNGSNFYTLNYTDQIYYLCVFGENNFFQKILLTDASPGGMSKGIPFHYYFSGEQVHVYFTMPNSIRVYDADFKVLYNHSINEGIDLGVNRAFLSDDSGLVYYLSSSPFLASGDSFESSKKYAIYKGNLKEDKYEQLISEISREPATYAIARYHNGNIYFLNNNDTTVLVVESSGKTANKLIPIAISNRKYEVPPVFKGNPQELNGMSKSERYLYFGDRYIDFQIIGDNIVCLHKTGELGDVNLITGGKIGDSKNTVHYDPLNGLSIDSKGNYLGYLLQGDSIFFYKRKLTFK